jgi:hypothetical protein
LLSSRILRGATTANDALIRIVLTADLVSAVEEAIASGDVVLEAVRE